MSNLKLGIVKTPMDLQTLSPRCVQKIRYHVKQSLCFSAGARRVCVCVECVLALGHYSEPEWRQFLTRKTRSTNTHI